MSPTPEGIELSHQSDELVRATDVLITGMSGRFPKSSSIKEFQDNLYNKVDMLDVPTERWEFSHPEMPPRLGICPDMETFDAQFFGIHYKQSASMDPTIRKLLECACEAIIDAGISPKSLRNTNTGVFMASSISESEKNLNYDSSTISGYGLTGSSRSMMGNRVSFWLGTQGPSYSSDNACCGGALALQQAYQAMVHGHCDMAIVGSSNLCLEPCVNLHFRWMELLTLSDKTRSFDKAADGYARSDSIVVFLLQKPKDAKRVYAQLVHTKTVYTGIREVDHMFQLLDKDRFGNFLRDFYKETDVKPEQVEYVEACGTGVNKADYGELLKIDEIFCPHTRKEPVKIGSVKSNMGNCESSSSLVSLVKICLAYQTGEVAGNLHLNNPRTDVDGVRSGRLQLLDRNRTFNRGYAAINTYSYNGVNGHILLKNYDIGKRVPTKLSDLPYLICTSSRNEETLKNTFVDLESKPLDPRQIALINNVYGNEVAGYLMRGYKIYNNIENEKPTIVSNSSEYFDGTSRPVWFVYSGMGSQWPTMGAQLMRFPVFAAAIERCCRVLQGKDLDLLRLLTDPDPETFSNILHSFVAIAAVQIGLTDLLHSLGITPDNIIGHSVGELGCAYADGCLSAEQMILAAYYRGQVSIQTPLIKGSMAAVGLGYTTIRSVCPPGIEVACHNGHDSSTVSGPADMMKAFVGELTKRGVFAKEVACSSIAYHSRYISAAGPGLKKYMSELIKDPKLRSARWVSSSVPQARWDEAAARFCSAEYLTNNLLNPVLFEEASRSIPEKAITIEIAPHGLLQAILNRSLSTNCINVSLTRRGQDNVVHLLNAVGKLFIAGLYPKLENLYPPVQFPVAADTPLLSHTLAWMHDEVWPVGCGRRPAPRNTGKYHHVLSTKDCDHEYLTGHFVNGVNIYPSAAHLVLIWETLAGVLGIPHNTLSVRFEDVRFNADIVIPTDEPLELIVYLQKSGTFEITKQGIAVTTGKVIVTEDFVERTLEDDQSDDIVLKTDDIYIILSLRGYNYSGDFQSIKSVNGNFTKAAIDFTDNWVTFLDALMQFSLLTKNNTGISRPKRIQSLDLNLKEFDNFVGSLKRNQYLQAAKYEKHGVTRCAGIVLSEFVTDDFNAIPTNNFLVQKHDFVPYNTEVTQENDAFKIHMQTIIENIPKQNIEVVELLDENDTSLKSELGLNELPDDVTVKVTTYVLPKDEINMTAIENDVDVIVVRDLSKYEQVRQRLMKNKNCFIMYIDKAATSVNYLNNFEILSCITHTKHNVMLLRKSVETFNPKIIRVTEYNFSSIQKVIGQITADYDVIMVATETGTEIIDKVRILRNEPNGHKIKLILIMDKGTPYFDPTLQFYKEQIKKGLAINVYENGAWGNYRHINLEEINAHTQHTELIATKPGDLGSLAWIASPALSETNKILVKVHYARLTCSDLLKVRPRKSMSCEEDVLDRTIGMSFSGTTKSGERVMGLVKKNSITSTVEADPELLWPVPEYWTLKEAATVPRAYVQALYYLIGKCSYIRPNMDVLVTSAAGALGQAVIGACIGIGCRVYATVGCSTKKNLLLKMFPQLTEKNICTSEDTALLQMVSDGTNGKGCELVINSASGSRRLVAMHCLAAFRNFMDIAVDDIEDNREFGMYFLTDGRSYMAANFASVFAPNESPLRKTLRKTIWDGITAGWVRPLSHVVFDSRQATRAFRFLSAGRNHGAVLLKLRNSSSVDMAAAAAWRCAADGGHLVVCARDALGAEVAERLVQCGARHVLIHSPDVNGYLKYKIKCWTSSGVDVALSTVDLSIPENANILLSNAAKMAPLSGVFIVRSSMDSDAAIQSLDSASRQYDDLRKFVLINLVEHKSNADNFCETICEERVKAKFSAINIRCNPIMRGDDQLKPREDFNVFLQNALQNLNKVLARGDINVTIRPVLSRARSVTKIIQEVLGLLSLDNIYKNVTLRELNMEASHLHELSNTMVEQYKISYELEDILGLTIKEIIDLDEEAKRGKETQENAFSIFFRHYEKENLFVSDSLVWMPTVISDGDNRVDFYKGEDYLIVVPGMDGHRHNMYRLCQRLRLRAVTCQYPVLVKPDSVQDIAQYFAEAIKTKIGIGKKFYILGYSFGALVALEMASIFEKNGMEGKVFCLDGSPYSIRTIMETHIQVLPEDQQQNHFLCRMYQLMAGEQGDILPKLEAEATWEGKVKACEETLKHKIEEPFEYRSLILNCAYKRLVQAKQYEHSANRLLSNVVLLRAKGFDSLPKDYGLNTVTDKPVTLYELPSSHASAPYDLRCSDIINRELNLDKSTVEAAIVRLTELNSSIDGRMIR